MKLKKVLKGFNKRFDESAHGETVRVVDLERIDFKDELSSPHGIGSQDLRPHVTELLGTLSADGHEPQLLPLSMNPSDLAIRIVVKK